jgi:hypothetical protein
MLTFIAVRPGALDDRLKLVKRTSVGPGSINLYRYIAGTDFAEVASKPDHLTTIECFNCSAGIFDKLIQIIRISQ